MIQLSGLDAAFIHQESPKTPMHVSPILIYGPVEGSSLPLSVDAIREALRDSLPNSSILTQKLVSLPMGMDEPYWVADRQFVLDQHIEKCQLSSPGNWEQLKKLLAQFHGVGLNMEKPLWQAYFIAGLDSIEGFPVGSTALMLKIHHAAIDGLSLAKLVSSLHDNISGSEDPLAKRHGGDPDTLEMWGRANVKNFTRQIKLASTVSRLIPAVSKMRGVKKPAEMTSKTQHSSTRLNTSVTRGRVIGALHIPLQDLKAIKRGVRRVTLNDIAMSIVGGALREYLSAHDELPRNSLVCGAPINLRSRDDSSSGNKIATMQVGLATDIEDPVARTRTVHQYAVMGKAKINSLGTGTVMDITDSVAPGMLAEGLRALSFASTRVSGTPVPFHVMISNVPGPVELVSLCDAPLLALIGLGPIRHSMGLFHVVSNSADCYTIAFTSCRSIMPDAKFYEQCLRNSYEALLEAAMN